MNPAAILALIADLYEQVMTVTAALDQEQAHHAATRADLEATRQGSGATGQ